VSWEISCEYINNLCADFNHFFLLFPGSWQPQRLRTCWWIQANWNSSPS
jgi:hypothetical protein